MPDGRSETFGYHPSGKLASITEIGVGGAAQQVWAYGWVGDDLVTIERPDGTGWRFVYGDSRLPGYMTRRILVGADDGNPSTPRPERVEGAWDYDGLGNAWKGSDDFATGAERHEFAYDEPSEPKLTTVTIHRSDTEQEVVTYALSRTASWVGAKPRVDSITGSCSGCGLGPDTQMSYDDPRHPLRPTRIVDGRGVATELTYDGNGQMISRLEAAETPLARETRWQYHSTFPALVMRIEGPGPLGFATARQTRMSYDPLTGALLSTTTEGQEATYPGGTFSLTTATQSNTAGQPLTTDPPGHGAADQTTFTYDRFGRLLQDGALTFSYDENGNRVGLEYPDGVVARYGFDFADRELSLEIQAGTGPVQPLVTGATYLPSGPLAQLTLGNGLVETRTFDSSYHPESIVIPGRLEQLYTTDAEGNIRTIDRAVGQERFLSTFDYQDPQYFLTRGDGPWGHQAWTYDRIGNRLTDAGSAYSYTPSSSGGHTAKLSRIDPAPDGELGTFLTYAFDAAGNQTTVARGSVEGTGRVNSLVYNAEGRLSRMSTSDGPAATELLYDGRGYLSTEATRRSLVRIHTEKPRSQFAAA